MASKKIESDFITKEGFKSYIRDDPPHFDTSKVNILGLGLGETIHRWFSNCVVFSSSKGPNINKTVWQCGEVSVVDILDIHSTPETKEELEIIVSGQREWGKDMRPSGWLSNKMGRKYGRDTVSFTTIPHAIFVGDSLANISLFQNINTRVAKIAANQEGLSVLRKHLKTTYTNRHLDWKYNEVAKKNNKEAYDNGYLVGKTEGYLQGWLDAKNESP